MPFGFESRALLVVGICISVLAAAMTIGRRSGLPRLSLVLGFIGLILWSLAAGGMFWRRAERQEVTVMVDVSPSTRTAAYRQRVALERRIYELIGNTPFRIVLFADGNREDSNAAVLEEAPSEKTVYLPPPTASAVLVFSDARFDLPASGPPTYPVIDPNIESPNDAAVRRLTKRGDEVVADVSNDGAARMLSLRGAATRPIVIEHGNFSIARPVDRESRQVTAELNAGDAWPENDRLTIVALPPMGAERWWVGGGAPAGWRAMEASALPQSSAEYLAPAVIVLNDISASAISILVQQRLDQYVRELGGALMILGGDHAFAAGDYGGTVLEGLSPLASTPPEPARRWVVLVDGSGSMAAATTNGQTQWEVAGRAVGQLMGVLPPKDLVAVGSFADHVTWWSNGRSVAETREKRLPPTDVGPHGPTNLERALADVTKGVEGGMPTEFLIVTDAEARLDQVDDRAKEMLAKKVRLHVLAIGNGSGVQILDRLATATGGSLTSALDATAWAGQLKQLGRSAMPSHLQTSDLEITFQPPLRLTGHAVKPWNQTWMKDGADALAVAKTERPVARWQVGAGQVVAVAFSPTAEEAEAMAKLVARLPADPRFKVSWDEGAKLAVHVDAVDGKTYLNNQSLSLMIERQGQTISLAIPQVGPGSYQLTVDAPRSPAFAAARSGERLLDRIAIAGRYAAEFEAIGNDHAAMRELARRTAGEVIDVRQVKPIEFRWPRREVSIVSWLAGMGAVCLAGALGWWRI